MNIDELQIHSSDFVFFLGFTELEVIEQVCGQRLENKQKMVQFLLDAFNAMQNLEKHVRELEDKKDELQESIKAVLRRNIKVLQEQTIASCKSTVIAAGSEPQQ